MRKNAKFPLEKTAFNCIIEVRKYLRKLLRSGGPSSNNGIFYYSCRDNGRLFIKVCPGGEGPNPRFLQF